MIFLLLFYVFLYLGEASKILVYSPSITTSHIISNGRIADTLAAAGHDVTVFIPEYMSEASRFKGIKKAKVKQMKGISKLFEEDLLGMDEYLLQTDTLSFSDRISFEYTLAHMCEEIMKRKAELEDLKNYGFEVAFAEQIDLCGLGVLRYLGIKNILWISTTPIMDAVSYNLGIPAPVSYVPTIEENDNGDVMSFWQRAYNLYMYLGAIYIHRTGTNLATEVFRRYVSTDFPNVREIAANASLCFVNADEMFDLPRPIIHKNIYIGGLGVSKPQALDEKFAVIMAKGKEGVIVFSLGSVANFNALDGEKKKAVASLVRRLPQYHFVIRRSKDDTSSEPFFMGLTNVDLVDWLPQSDLLGHPRLKLFIMHGGLNGLTEANLRGVPVIVIPIFADQFRNGRNVEKRGIGKVILKRDFNEKNLFETVSLMIKDDRFKKNALRIQKLMLEKPFSPEERLVKWTEFAINNGVLEELHVEGSRMNVIVYFNLDVFAAIFLLTFLSFYVLYRLLYCFGRVAPQKRKED